MIFRKSFLLVGMATLILAAQCCLVASKAAADGAASPPLVVSQFKVSASDGQFFTLYNPSASDWVNLANFELEYFNNNDLTKATSTKIVPLSGMLAPQSFYMLSDGAATICYQITVDTASLGFSSTSGFAEVLQLPSQTSAGSLVVPNVIDYVGWTKKTSGGNDTLSVSPAAASVVVPNGTSIQWLRQMPVASPGTGTWLPTRPDPNNPCSLQQVQSGGTTTPISVNPGNVLGMGPMPPSTIVSLASDTAGPAMPQADVGLAAPQLSEILPNPTGAGNDGTDEFIELYNPNPEAFDLEGFTLQTGATTKHSYTFPGGTVLPPLSFTSFYSADTGLSLSNTSGQADLLGPYGNMLSQTDVYSAAKDGQTWAFANGKWYWTSVATPGSANVIKQVTTAAKSSKSTSGARPKAGAVKGASTTSASGSGNASAAANVASPAPIHPYMLAAVAVLAVGYGVYEYRHDLANYVHQLRKHRADRKRARLQP